MERRREGERERERGRGREVFTKPLVSFILHGPLDPEYNTMYIYTSYKYRNVSFQSSVLLTWNSRRPRRCSHFLEIIVFDV